MLLPAHECDHFVAEFIRYQTKINPSKLNTMHAQASRQQTLNPQISLSQTSMDMLQASHSLEGFVSRIPHYQSVVEVHIPTASGGFTIATKGLNGLDGFSVTASSNRLSIFAACPSASTKTLLACKDHYVIDATAAAAAAAA
jgi:hypothetical protein